MLIVLRSINFFEKYDPSIKDFGIKDEFLCFKDSIIIIETGGIRKIIMQEAYQSPFFAHPSGVKMRENLKQNFYQYGMKKDVNQFVTKCLEFQKVKVEHLECQKGKVEHQNLGGLSYPYDIPI